jgi:hypothetical protein
MFEQQKRRLCLAGRIALVTAAGSLAGWHGAPVSSV